MPTILTFTQFLYMGCSPHIKREAHHVFPALSLVDWPALAFSDLDPCKPLSSGGTAVVNAFAAYDFSGVIAAVNAAIGAFNPEFAASRADLVAQVFAGHDKNIPVGFAGGGFKVFACPSADVKNVTLVVHENSRRRVTVQDQLIRE